MEHPLYKIFIVDDDTFLLNMYSLKFNKNGYEVLTSQSGESALKIIESGYIPDIVLLDVIMPGMDGLELLSLIRQKKLVTGATIIMLTNQSELSDIEKAKKLNVNSYIVKATTIPSEVIAEVARVHEEAKKS